MANQKNSNKSYTSMLDHHEEALGYSIFNQKIIHSLEIDTICFLNLLK